METFFAIHPVAGRMPGHMNVLLAEANVPYDELKEMDEANPEMSTADVALVVGANDTVNPAAKSTPGSPIYGMPIINADEAENIIFLKRSMRPGFAGIDNELLYDPKTTHALRRRQGHAAETRVGRRRRLSLGLRPARAVGCSRSGRSGCSGCGLFGLAEPAAAGGLSENYQPFRE